MKRTKSLLGSANTQPVITMLGGGGEPKGPSRTVVLAGAGGLLALLAVGVGFAFGAFNSDSESTGFTPVVIDIPAANSVAGQPLAPPAPPVVAAVNRFDFASILSGGPSSVLPGTIQLVTIASTAHTVPSVAVPNKKPDVAATDLVGRTAGVTELSQQSVDLMFNSSVFPCGQGVVAFTVCPEQPLPVPAGRFIVGVEALGGPVPLADPQGSYQFSMAFDSDGDAANNFRAVAPLTKNWLHGVDQSYLLNYAPGQAWNIRVSNYTTGQPQRLASGARAVILDNVILYFIPATELKSASPQYRLCLLAHRRLRPSGRPLVRLALFGHRLASPALGFERRSRCARNQPDHPRGAGCLR